MADHDSLSTTRKDFDEIAKKVWAIFRSFEALRPLIEGTESYYNRVKYIKETLQMARDVKYDVSARVVWLNYDLEKLKSKSKCKRERRMDMEKGGEDDGENEEGGGDDTDREEPNGVDKAGEHELGKIDVLELWLEESGKWNVKLGNVIEEWKEELNMLEKGV